jgi:acetylornithine/N-succinyldiaminopimelate aminotransferase
VTFERASPNAKDWRTKRVDEFTLHTYAREEEVFVRGEGAWLFDESGAGWLDFASGLGVSALGHGHPALIEALQHQVGEVLHTSNLWRHPLTEDVAARLTRLTGLAGVFFCNSGAEANEAALKIACKYHYLKSDDRSSFVALQDGFHGRTLGALAVTANPNYRLPFGPLRETTFVECEDQAALRTALERKPAALILEVVQGEGGLNVLSSEFLVSARELCDETGTLLICDEVQTGCGRTGSFLASSQAGIQPDIVTLAKPLGAGVPIGATIVREGLTDVLAVGDHGSTFGGGPLALRAAQVFLQQYEHGLSDAVQLRGAQLEAGLNVFAEKYSCVAERRGRGLMQGLSIPNRAAEVRKTLYSSGMLALTATPDVLRLLPPFVITEADVTLALERIDAALASLPNQ